MERVKRQCQQTATFEESRSGISGIEVILHTSVTARPNPPLYCFAGGVAFCSLQRLCCRAILVDHKLVPHCATPFSAEKSELPIGLQNNM